MRNGDQEFHSLTNPLITLISRAAEKTAKAKLWTGLEISLESDPALAAIGRMQVHCFFRDPRYPLLVNQATPAMIEAGEKLQRVFAAAGTPFRRVVINYVNGVADPSQATRTSFEY